jgi:hypothetical protein
VPNRATADTQLSPKLHVHWFDSSDRASPGALSPDYFGWFKPLAECSDQVRENRRAICVFPVTGGGAREDEAKGGTDFMEERELAGPVPSGVSIRVMRGFFEGLELPIDRDWMVVGRGRMADVIIAEPTISRAHLAIGFDGEHFFCEDLGSTNGTAVNGKREARMKLNPGDEILLGKLLLQVTLPDGY